MSAWYLKKKLGELCRVTIFEASDRLGGKVLTRKFETAPAMYEAGVAEIYDYSMTGPDPLRELIQHFGLQTIPMDAEQVQLDGELLNDIPGMRRKYGTRTADAIAAFRRRCTELMSPIDYYEGVGAHDNDHPWAFMTAEELLDKGRYAQAMRTASKTAIKGVPAVDFRYDEGNGRRAAMEAKRPLLEARKQRVIAIAQLRLGNAKAAKPKLAALLKQKPDDPSLQARYAEALIATGDKTGGEMLAELESRPLYRAIEESVDVAFVPYDQLDGVQPGGRVLSCLWGVILCEEVGEVTEVLAGEVATLDPWGEPARGQYAILDLDDPAAVRARSLRIRP